MITPVRVAHEVDPSNLDAPAGRAGFARRVAAELRAAVTMLTRLPIRGDPGMVTGAAAFGIVGGLLGLVGMIPLIGLGGVTGPIAAILAIAVIVIVSGAVHFDGLADTADALMAVAPDGAERARTDPSVGVGGVVALVLVLAADVTSLASVVIDAGPLVAGIACVVAGGVSRVVPVALARLMRASAPATGLGGWFAARTTTPATVAAIGSVLLMIVAAGLVLSPTAAGVTVASAGATGGLAGLALGVGVVRVRGQLDGDVLGASVELSFALTILVAAVLIGSVG